MTRTMLVHLNVEAADTDSRSAEDIGAMLGRVVRAGLLAENVVGLTVDVAMSEQIDGPNPGELEPAGTAAAAPYVDGVDEAVRIRELAEADPARQIESFAVASIEVALDCSPGDDDDHLFQTWGVMAADVDTSDERMIRITLESGRRFLITVDVSEIKEG